MSKVLDEWALAVMSVGRVVLVPASVWQEVNASQVLDRLYLSSHFVGLLVFVIKEAGFVALAVSQIRTQVVISEWREKEGRKERKTRHTHRDWGKGTERQTERDRATELERLKNRQRKTDKERRESERDISIVTEAGFVTPTVSQIRTQSVIRCKRKGEKRKGGGTDRQTDRQRLRETCRAHGRTLTLARAFSRSSTSALSSLTSSPSFLHFSPNSPASSSWSSRRSSSSFSCCS